MRVLLDTHVLLWALAEPRRLDEETRAAIESGDTDVLFSAASIWEIAVKAELGRGDFAFDPAEIAPSRARYRIWRTGGSLERGCSRRPTAFVVPRSLRPRSRRAGDRRARTLYTADRQLVPYSDLVKRIGAR